MSWRRRVCDVDEAPPRILNNPGFNSLEFEGIGNAAGGNSFFLSAKKWIEATGTIGLHAKAGRYGGTYAHKDIAFEFGSWLSPVFKLYLIKEPLFPPRLTSAQTRIIYASEADLLNVALFGITATRRLARGVLDARAASHQ